MARGDRGVTCQECGCLNFSPEHEVCDRCRPKTSTLHRATSRPVGSADGHVLSTSSAKSCEIRVHSVGKKRRHHKTKHTSHTKLKHNRNLANQEPDVIDLISDNDDDDDDVAVKQMVVNQDPRQRQETDELSDHEHENKKSSLFQSRVFPFVTFVDNHFPSVNAVATMRKQAVKNELTTIEPIGEVVVASVTSTSDQVLASEPTLAVLGPTPMKVAKSTFPSIVESHEVETLLTAMPEKTSEDKLSGDNVCDTVMTNDAVESDAAGILMQEKEAEQDGLMLKDSLFQSRVFDLIEFRASDFVTAFDGLAVARRSHPPISKTIPSTGTFLTFAAAIVATKSEDCDTNDEAVPVKATTVKLSTTESTAPSATMNTVKSTVSLPSMSAASKVPTSTHTEVILATSSTISTVTTPAESSIKLAITPAKLPPATPSASVSHAPFEAPVTSAALPPTTVKAPVEAPAVAPIEVSSLPSQTSNLKMQSVASAASSLPTPTAVTQNPAAFVPSTIKATLTTALTAETAETADLATLTPESTTAANSATTTASGAPAAHPNNAHVLMPRKKPSEETQRSGELQRCQKPSSSGINVFFDANETLFVKVNPCELVHVEQPVLGYCSPEFLDFMRECGDDDGDEDGDPDEVSRSQLKLLDVVDLTNLSESEDSGVDSPSATSRVKGPKEEAQQHTLLSNEQARIEGQSIVYIPVNAFGKGMPTRDSERKRTYAERIMCELCEEKVVSSRLICCPVCKKYYHKKCARENGNENICWNCELGSMIDDSELDEEHAKHNSEYLAYLRALRSSIQDGEGAVNEISADNENQEGDQGSAEEDETASSTAGEEDSHSLPEESSAKAAGKRWKEFIGDATADIDASYLEVTKRIAEELRDDEKRRFYSRGFVSREEFEAQMTEVEEFYIKEEARLQQLEREKALEAKKAAEANKMQPEAEQAIIAEQSAGNSTIADSTAAMLKPPVIHGGSTAASVSTGQTSLFTSTTVIAPADIALTNSATAPVAAPAMLSTRLQPAEPVAAHTPVPTPSVPFTTLAAFRAKLDNTPAAGSQPPSLQNIPTLSFDRGQPLE